MDARREHAGGGGRGGTGVQRGGDLLRGPAGPVLRRHSLGVGVAVIVGLNPLVYA